MNTNVLVTGGCGFVGYALTKKLIELGFAVDVVDNLFIGDEAKKPELLGANFLGGDVREFDLIPDKQYKYIFHLAAISRIQPSFTFPDVTLDTNVTGTRKVLDYARKNNCKVIYAGSSSRHHNPELSPYAMSKFLGEQLCRLYRKVYNVDVDIARFYNVYGEGELVHSHMAAVIGIFRKQIQMQIPLTVHGDGEQRRDFTHIDDIVDGLIKIAYNTTPHTDAWELGAGFNYSINQVFDMFNEKYNFTLQKNHVSDVKGNYRRTLRENNDALDILQWRPKNKLKEYIQSL